MIVAFAAIILALSNGITLLISTISLSTFKAIRACGIECKMSDNDSCSDTEEDYGRYQQLIKHLHHLVGNMMLSLVHLVRWVELLFRI